jgi:D-glycero-alpha-D-manno-heptose 1-phosphate guanylyltransferase
VDALVLAGGLGTRLRERVPDVPKPMAPVAGRPFLEHLLVALQSAGVTRAVLAIGHGGPVVVDHVGAGLAGLPVDYSWETEPLGTGGAVRAALPQLTAPFLLVNGDTWAPVLPQALLAARTSSGLVMTLCPVPDVGRYGAAVVSGDLVVGVTEKGGQGPGLINAGVYLVGEPLVGDLSAAPDVFSFERHVLEGWVTARGAGFVVAEGPFVDIGVPADYDRAAQVLGAAVIGAPRD